MVTDGDLDWKLCVYCVCVRACACGSVGVVCMHAWST
jgi:hypothetical protein